MANKANISANSSSCAALLVLAISFIGCFAEERDIYLVLIEGEPLAFHGSDDKRRFDLNSDAYKGQTKRLMDSHDRILQSTLEIGSYNKLYSFKYTVNGFAVHLTPTQAKKLENAPQVKLVERDRRAKLMTSYTPQFLGLPQGVWTQRGGDKNAGRHCFISSLLLGELSAMASLFKDQRKLSAYRDRRFPGTQEEFEEALLASTTVYVGNMSFYTTEEQIYELFSRAGEIKKIIMGLDKNSKTPCGFCFALFYSREDTEDAVKYISGTILDDRPIRVDFDWGFQDGRQWGRGRSGGQVRDEYRTDYDPGRGGYGKLVQRELEAQRQLVDYGTGSLTSFQPVMPPRYGRHGGGHGHGGSHRHGRDYQRKRHREDDRHAHETSKRSADFESRRNSDPDSRPEKNPRFRESGDSDDDEDDDRKQRS